MEQEGRMASTVGRRLSTLSSFYRYCQTEDILDKNPALNVRRPKVHDEPRTLGLDRKMPTDRLLPRRQAPRRPIRGGSMTTKKMTRREEHDFYADPENQTPQGPPRRRTSKLSELVPVRFPPETLAKIRDATDADDRSVSAWIRRAVDRELEQTSRTA
jgi:hypothetical protein